MVNTLLFLQVFYVNSTDEIKNQNIGPVLNGSVWSLINTDAALVHRLRALYTNTHFLSLCPVPSPLPLSSISPPVCSFLLSLLPLHLPPQPSLFLLLPLLPWVPGGSNLGAPMVQHILHTWGPGSVNTLPHTHILYIYKQT